MMLLLQKLLTCIRSRIDNGPFSKHQQSRVKVFLRAWIGISSLSYDLISSDFKHNICLFLAQSLELWAMESFI
jgi:hypothetical protein